MGSRWDSVRSYHETEYRLALGAANEPALLPEVRPGELVLDIGCGAGQTLAAVSLKAAAAGSAGGRLKLSWVGLDRDLPALQAGRELNPEMHFACGSGAGMPFGPAQFDLVIARVSLPYMHIPRALAEAQRVLRPGGRLWATFHPFAHSLGQARGANWKGKLFFGYVLLNSALMHATGRLIPFRPGRYESFQTERAVKRALIEAGFGSIEIRRDDRQFLATATA